MNDRIVHASDHAYLKAAFSKLGLSEIAGPENEPQVLAMYVACGHPEIHDDETAWCAAFVGWCLKQGGLRNTGSLMARSYEHYGTQLDLDETVPRGAILVWVRAGGGHVNYCLHDDGQYVTCIGGNQENGRGGGVTISRRLKSQAVAARMPVGVVAAVPLPRPKPAPAPAPIEPEERDVEPTPEPAKPPKTGITEGAQIATGFSLIGIITQAWDAITQAPEALLNLSISAAQKPVFWFAVAFAAAVFVWWRRHQQKKAAA